jgi:diguanylate cyclase
LADNTVGNLSRSKAIQDFSESTIAFLESHDLAPTPRNYTLIYSYFSGSHPEVRAEIDRLLALGAFGQEVALRLYEDAFGFDGEARSIKEVSNNIENTLTRILGDLGQAGRDAGEYGIALKNFNRETDFDGPAIAHLKEAVTSILSETKKMELRSITLEKKFSESKHEIVTLRQNLDEMHLAATTDGLTAIANRKQFDLFISEAVEDAATSDRALTLLLGDIDHFKTFNDDYGHQTGDLVLRLVAKTLSDCVRGQDLVARYGGEEFAVILPQTGLEGAFAVGENIRKTIAAKRIARKATGETLGMVTLSFGVAQLKEGETASSLIGRADEGLYRAKDRGRNRLESIDPMANEICNKLGIGRTG